MRKLIKEIKALWLLTIYFAVWFGMLVLVKRLLLAQYQIEFRGASLAAVGGLVTAKVVIVMEHVSSAYKHFPTLATAAVMGAREIHPKL